nr:RecName: Full=Lectin 31 kDa subunit; AltName: Full=Hemagglutinin 31 kDa subunit [Vigna unguiculata subsp. sesquipedalis]
ANQTYFNFQRFEETN